MTSVACGTCRAVAPLIARYNDPDLGEAERVLLSTHLLQCATCLARLQEYRALDQQMRRMSGMTLAPHVREAILERVAAPGYGQPGIALVWKQAWVGTTAAITLTAVIFAFGLATFGAAHQSTGSSPHPSSANEMFARPMTTTILGANPTQVTQVAQVANTFSESVSGTVISYNLRASNVTTVRATVREVNAREGRLIVQVEGTKGAEELAITGTSLILWSDGSRGSLSDLVAGAAIQIERDQNTTVARKITLTRPR